MKVKELLTEVFDSEINGKIIKKTNSSFVTKATIGDRDIEFYVDGYQGHWECAFLEKSNKKGDTFGKSGSGNELQVFSFVIESLKLFISMYQPDSVFFTSDKSDGNRTKLYARIANRVAIPNYSVTKDNDDSSGSSSFRIVRNK